MKKDVLNNNLSKIENKGNALILATFSLFHYFIFATFFLMAIYVFDFTTSAMIENVNYVGSSTYKNINQHALIYKIIELMSLPISSFALTLIVSFFSSVIVVFSVIISLLFLIRKFILKNKVPFLWTMCIAIGIFLTIYRYLVFEYF